MLALLTILPYYAQSEPNAFAGNLEPPKEDLTSASSGQDAGGVTNQLSTNQTESMDAGDSMHLIYTSTEGGADRSDKKSSSKPEMEGTGNTDRMVDSGDSTNGTNPINPQQQEVKKAQRPVSKAESVGFKPAAKEERVVEEKVQDAGKTDNKDLTVRKIPNLPPRSVSISVTSYM